MTAALTTAHAIPQTALKPCITIVVSPRDCFSYARQSLESIYQHTNIPFELVYVDAGSPRHIQNYLIRAATRRGFTIVRSDRFLTPNQSRNLGLSQVTTDYVVFVDNDIHVSSGWLEKLWKCAKETDASVVCPLTCVGSPLHEHIHLAGGDARIFMDVKDNQVRRRLYEKRFLTNRSTADANPHLYRRLCEFAELHCVLVKRDIFGQIGYLDENLLSTQEDMDFCLTINRIGGRMFCETEAVVTYVPQAPRHWSDLAYFMLRWSDTWEVESLMHFQQKWDLDMDHYFLQRYKQLGYRRRQAFLYPLLHWITKGHTALWLEKLAIDVERRLNQIITDRHAHFVNNTIRKLVPTHGSPDRKRSIISRLQRLVFRRNATTQLSRPHLMPH